jgi:pimeloyl-ACP methyl ester carboxylesterase
MIRFLHWMPIAVALWVAGAHAQLPEFTRQTQSLRIAGTDESVDVYRPGIGPPRGVAIVAHGFTRSRIRHKDLGQALARAGVVAVIPDLPNVVDHWGNGDAIVDLTQALEAGALALPPVDRSHIVLIGTSAGGLATVLAASRMPGLGGWIGLDPVDRTGSGIDAAAQVGAPSVVLLGSGSTCNLFGSGGDIARALPNLLRMVRLPEASHCDFEDPTNNFCRALCGRSSAQMQSRIRAETVRATVEMLNLAALKAGAAPEADASDGNDPMGPPEPVPEPEPDGAPAPGDSHE